MTASAGEFEESQSVVAIESIEARSIETELGNGFENSGVLGFFAYNPV